MNEQRKKQEPCLGEHLILKLLLFLKILIPTDFGNNIFISN
jgi:hypothetical protein